MSVLKDNHASKQLFAHYQLTDSTITNITNLLYNKNVSGFGGTWVKQTERFQGQEVFCNTVTGSGYNNAGFCSYHQYTLDPNSTVLYINFYKQLLNSYGKDFFGYAKIQYTDNTIEQYNWSFFPSNWSTDEQSIGIWQKVIGTITLSKTKIPKTCTVFYVYRDNATIGGKCNFSNFQLLQSQAPMYVENFQQGYCINNKNANGTLLSGDHAIFLSDDSAIYDKSVRFNGDMEQYLKRSAFTNIRNNLSISCWIKLLSGNKSNTPQYIISQGGHHTKVGVSIYSSADGGSLYCDIGTESSTALQIPFNGFVKNQWCHAVVVYDGNHVQTFLNGQPLNSIIDKLPKLNGNIVWGEYVHDFVLGRRAYINSSSPNEDTSFNGLLSDVRLYSTALSTQDVLSLYQVRKKISKEGDIYINLLDENTNYIKSSINKQGIQKASCLNETSEWIPIMYHNNLGGTVLFNERDNFNTFIYHSPNCWSNFSAIEKYGNINNKWHFKLLEQRNDGVYDLYEWYQTIDPNNATWSSTGSDSVIGVSGKLNPGGAIYKARINSQYVIHNSCEGCWYGAIGAWKSWGSGIPKTISESISGLKVLWLEIPKSKVQEYNHGVIYANSFNEVI